MVDDEHEIVPVTKEHVKEGMKSSQATEEKAFVELYTRIRDRSRPTRRSELWPKPATLTAAVLKTEVVNTKLVEMKWLMREFKDENAGLLAAPDAERRARKSKRYTAGVCTTPS